jgi:hypothetical protein
LNNWKNKNSKKLEQNGSNIKKIYIKNTKINQATWNPK